MTRLADLGRVVVHPATRTPPSSRRPPVDDSSPETGRDVIERLRRTGVAVAVECSRCSWDDDEGMVVAPSDDGVPEVFDTDGEPVVECRGCLGHIATDSVVVRRRVAA